MRLRFLLTPCSTILDRVALYAPPQFPRSMNRNTTHSPVNLTVRGWFDSRIGGFDLHQIESGVVVVDWLYIHIEILQYYYRLVNRSIMNLSVF